MNRIDRVKEIITRVSSKGKHVLSEHDSKVILNLYGVPVNREVLINTRDELERFLSDSIFEYPLVMKVDSPDILHKTEAKAVKLNINNKKEARRAYREILENALRYNPQAMINGVLIQEMLQGAVAECLVGITRDTQFGPVLIYGLGGVWVEVFKDIALRLPPLTKQEALEMLLETRGHKLLQGFRNRPEADLSALCDTLIKMSNLALELKDYIVEADINPVLVFEKGKGVQAVDALIYLAP